MHKHVIQLVKGKPHKKKFLTIQTNARAKEFSPNMSNYCSAQPEHVLMEFLVLPASAFRRESSSKDQAE